MSKFHVLLEPAIFDACTDFDQARERLNKFHSFYELSTVENNTLFKLYNTNL